VNRAIPVLALVLIGLGVLGLAAVGVLLQSPLAYNSPQQNFAPLGMMGGFNGMMNANGGMMGIVLNATPVPPNQPIDREVKIIVRNSQFDPTRIIVKKGETVKFTLVNQDAIAHNFVSQDGNILYTPLPPNAVQSVIWVAQEQGTYTALCTLHAGMKTQVIVE
jgi:plastocyanin